MTELTPDVMTISMRLVEAVSSHEAHIYEGAGHAFFNDTRDDRYHQNQQN